MSLMPPSEIAKALGAPSDQATLDRLAGLADAARAAGINDSDLINALLDNPTLLASVRGQAPKEEEATPEPEPEAEAPAEEEAGSGAAPSVDNSGLLSDLTSRVEMLEGAMRAIVKRVMGEVEAPKEVPTSGEPSTAASDPAE